MARHNEIGKIGEDISVKWLISQNYIIVERNYLKKWGEIDIVARGTGDKLHFIEVKSVSYETRKGLEYSVSRETFRPEENVHPKKQERLKRAIQTWITENKYEGEWQINILTVRMVPREKYAQIKFLENIIFE